MKPIKIFLLATVIVTSANIQAAPWSACGKLGQMTSANNWAIPSKPISIYEYGMAYNSPEPVPIIATKWDQGIRIYNKTPYLVFSDNPDNVNTRLGGFVFFSGTQATDDNCGVGNFRHRYWSVENLGVVRFQFSNGCYGASGTGIAIIPNGGFDPNPIPVGTNPVVYCRAR